MEKVPAELMKEYVNSQKFTSTTEIMEAMKAMFGDVLQQVMEAELDTKLGYEKSERTSNDDENGLSKNYRNGHSKKTVKTQLGEVTINIPRDRNGEYEPSIIGKYNRNADGKDILGIWIGEHESAKFWLNVLNDLKNRGVQSVYVFCVDGLTGFRDAISSVYPKAQIQRCIIHQIRSSTKFVSYKDIKKLMSDLKTVYQAINEEEALNNLMKFKEIWGKTYPSCVKSWEENWDILSTFFAYPAEVRRIIYTTNIIEGLNRQFRSITKTKPSFTNDDSLRKMLYLASKKIVEHWTARCRNWDQVLNQLDIMFSEQKVG